ncbi:Uncharacterised protein [Acinetobacter baumannii]|nr:Uncharacterised protein [Acinetobacter baumannii]
MTRPTETSSPRAFSSSLRSRWASWLSSSKNDAPCSRSTSSTLAARGDSSGSGASRCRTLQSPSSRRGRSTIGALRSGPPAALLRPARRAQTMRPERHSWSSQWLA